MKDARAAATAEDAMLPALDEALRRLEQIDPEQARMVGFDMPMTLGVGVATY